MAPSLAFASLPFTDVKLRIIQPLRKTNHVDVIHPTFLDSQYQDMYNPIMSAFRLGETSEAVYAEQMKLIIGSLQEVLIPFFQYAGRWIVDPKDSSKRKLLCNDAGVPIIEAYLDRDLDSVVEASAAFQPVPELQGFQFLGMDMTQFQQQLPPEGLPCIFLQFTRFRCGGVVAALTFSHQLADGNALFFQFFTAWYEIKITKETTIKVDHDRAQFERIVTHRQTKDISSTNSVGGASVFKRGTWAMKAFEASASAIKSIKQEVKDTKQGGGYVSTVDCIAAHLWRIIAGLPSSMRGGKDVAVVSLVEGRTRFYDTPPSNVSGNFVSSVLGPTIPYEVLQNIPLGSLATKLREALHTAKREDWLDLDKPFASNRFAAIHTISWLGFPLYQVDFGWGNPVIVSQNSFGSEDGRLGKFYVLPPHPDSTSSIATLQMYSTPEILAALENNPLFLEMFLGLRNGKQALSKL